MEPCCPAVRWIIRGIVICAALALAWFVATPVRSQDTGASGILKHVPPDAIGFMHVKVRDIWKSDSTSSLRDILTKVGPETLEAFHKRFPLNPANLDSAALFILPPDDNQKLAAGLVVSFNDAFDPNKVLKTLLPKAASIDFLGQKYVEDRDNDMAARIIDSKTVLLTNAADMRTMLGHEMKGLGTMSSHFTAAANATLYATLDSSLLPPTIWDQVPEAARVAVKAKPIVLTGQFAKDMTLKLQLKYQDDAQTTAAEKSARAGADWLREKLKPSMDMAEKRVTKTGDDGNAGVVDLPDAATALLALAAARAFDNYLNTIPLVKQGNSLTLEVKADPNSPQTLALASAFGYSVMMPAAVTAKAAAKAASGQANLKQIGTAMNKHHQATNRFPTQAIWSKDQKKKLLSWRVSLLPYLGHNGLYREFKLDEAWDSEQNRKLITKIPDVYLDVDARLGNEPGLTHYRVFFGGGSGFRDDFHGVAAEHIIDGLSQTIMVVTANDPVVWTKPDDFQYSGQKPLPKLGLNNKAANVLFFDGSVRTLGGEVTLRNMRAMITAANGELIVENQR